MSTANECHQCQTNAFTFIEGGSIEDNHLIMNFSCTKCKSEWLHVRQLKEHELKEHEEIIINNSIRSEAFDLAYDRLDWASEPQTIFMGKVETDETA